MTISEIAKLAGVSNATVSRYLNNGYVSADKKERIRSVIEQTGYAPSMQAQVMRTGKTRLIGVVLPKIDSESISRVVSGISAELSREGYELLLADTENSIEQEINYLQVFSARVDGIIFIATILTPRHKELIKKMSIPVVVIGQYADYASCVYHDDYHASFSLTKCLVDAGKKHIGYIGVTPKDIAAGAERQRGYADALREANLTVKDSYQYIGIFHMDSGYDGAKELLGAHPKLDALYCATDQIAVGAMKYLKEMGLRIPQDVSVVGIGHTRMSTVITPTLTTVHYYYKTSGIEAARLLLEKLAHPDTPIKKTMLGYELIMQESVSHI